ncbi:MAG: RNA-guided endonuclease TnpB family protein [Candidatus Bathyarchaeota archaeon]|nr:RNA-guided endonuclease TnpB family protein [Candidatus Bathyarchaeota archaeon]
MRKCILLNTVNLTPRKQEIFNSFFAEYLRVLNETFKRLPDAKSSTQLHRLTYFSIRETSFLPSDIVQEARKDVWAKRKTIKDGFKRCSIRLNKRWFRLVKSERGNPCFKITYSPRKTFTIPVKLDNQLKRFSSFLDDGWCFSNISFLDDGKIAVVLEKKFSKPENNRRFVVGVDVGSSTLAAVTIFDTKTSKVEGQLYFGRDVANKQRRFFERRRKLQSYADKRSGKAKKYLRKLKHKQRNFVKNRSGEVAKQIVTLAKRFDASVAIEKLGIRGRKRKFSKKSNRKINLIPYGRFKEFLSANCETENVPLSVVDAYHTSMWCPHCGAVNKGHHSGNYALYKCKMCGLTMNSDRKASLAVAVKSVLERTSQDLTKPCFVQISNTRVPVNRLVRPDADGLTSAVQHV